MAEKNIVTFVFFGIVGSGKGTQVKLLQEHLEKRGEQVAYIGTGEIFRKNPEIKEMIKEILNRGQLVPDAVTNQVVREALSAESDLANKNIVFDGYPRTVPQAAEFEKMIQKYDRNEIKIIYIELSETEAMRRNLLRGRHDDTEAGLKQRFAEYRNKVVPAMEYFRGKPGYEILTINGEQTIENVHQDILKNLKI